MGTFPLSNRAVLTLLATILVLWLTYIRLPPRVTLLNHPETKKILIELKSSKRIEDEVRFRKKTGNDKKPERVIRIHGSDDYDSDREGDSLVVDDDVDISDEKHVKRGSVFDLNEEDSSSSLDEDRPIAADAQYRVLTKWDIDPEDAERKYFVYQPSGGWGNQRMILRWAMRVANAMGRTLIVPMVAPHNKMWYGYDNLNASEMIPADRVLDMDALEAGTIAGVRVFRDHLSKLPSVLKGTWIRNSKKSALWLTENMIKSRWRGLSYQVVFWNKGSMWECCAGGTMMTPFVMFSRELKEFSLEIASKYFKGQRYNAVHVRRGGGHTRIDRRTAKHYLDRKITPAGFDKRLPIYIATDEKNKTWFEYWGSEGYKYIFWKDLASTASEEVAEFLDSFPPRTHNDVIGFLEQLICGRAVKWTGSDGSTFSYSIESMRHFKTLVDVDWARNMDPTTKRIYSRDGRGVRGPTKEAEVEEEMEKEQPGAMGEETEDKGEETESFSGPNKHLDVGAENENEEEDEEED